MDCLDVIDLRVLLGDRNLFEYFCSDCKNMVQVSKSEPSFLGYGITCEGGGRSKPCKPRTVSRWELGELLKEAPIYEHNVPGKWDVILALLAEVRALREELDNQ